MKKLFLMLASLFLAVNVASATPSQKVDFSSFSKTDSQFLFDGNTNAIALSSQEMKETEGEWGWFIPLFIGWGTAVANAPDIGGRTYRSSIRRHYSRSWFSFW